MIIRSLIGNLYYTAQSLEWILHKRYKHNAIHREWFRMPASDVLKDIGFALDLLKLIAPGVNLGNIVIPSQHPVKPSPAPQNVPPPPSGFVLKKPTNQRNEDTDDEIYEAACIVIRRQKKASISLLQRRFRIGYVRAARIMARIEDSGLLSELFLVEQGDGGFR